MRALGYEGPAVLILCISGMAGSRRPGGVFLSAFSRAVAFPARGRAIPRLRQLAVRANASLSVDAPEQAFIRWRDGRVGLGEDELCFPAQCRAEIGMFSVETIGLLKRGSADHAAPSDAAFMMARLTA